MMGRVWRPTCAVLSQNSLPPLDETLFVSNQVADLDDVACHSILKDLDRLRGRYGSGKKLDQITGVEDSCWVVCLQTSLGRREG